MNPTESQTNEPPPVSAVRFRPEPPSQNAEGRENREKDHDADWKDVLVLPLVRFMQQREMKAISITVDAGIAGFELTPKGEAVLIYELVDATDEERYYPMGLFLNLATALREAVAHHPGKWEPIMDTAAVAEIRARKVGTSGGDYAVLWRGHWHHDYEAGEWKLAEQQTGTLEKPLPMTRA